MDSRNILVVVILLSASSCQLSRTSDREQPRPRAFFLQILGRINGRAGATQKSGLRLEEDPIKWAKLEGEGNQQNLFKSPVPGHRVPRELRGCQLGTCQIQNLADLLYRYGSNHQKEESQRRHKGANDPMGYGRKKRQAAGHGLSSPT